MHTARAVRLQGLREAGSDEIPSFVVSFSLPERMTARKLFGVGVAVGLVAGTVFCLAQPNRSLALSLTTRAWAHHRAGMVSAVVRARSDYWFGGDLPPVQLPSPALAPPVPHPSPRRSPPPITAAARGTGRDES